MAIIMVHMELIYFSSIRMGQAQSEGGRMANQRKNFTAVRVLYGRNRGGHGNVPVSPQNKAFEILPAGTGGDCI